MDWDDVLPPDERISTGPQPILSADVAKRIIRRFRAGEKQRDLAREFGLDPSLVSRLVRGEGRWYMRLHELIDRERTLSFVGAMSGPADLSERTDEYLHGTSHDETQEEIMVNADYTCPRCGGGAGAHFAFCFLAQAWERFMGPQYPWSSPAHRLTEAQTDLQAATADLQAVQADAWNWGGEDMRPSAFVDDALRREAKASVALDGETQSYGPVEVVNEIEALVGQPEPEAEAPKPEPLPERDPDRKTLTTAEVNRLMRVLDNRGMNRADLCRALGIPQGHLAGITTGSRPSNAVRLMVLDWLDKVESHPERLAPILPPEGLTAPERISSTGAAVEQFVADCFETAPATDFVILRRISDAYNRWAKEHGAIELTGQGLSGWLSKLGYVRRRPVVNGVQLPAFYGLRLKAHPEWTHDVLPQPEPEPEAEPVLRAPGAFGGMPLTSAGAKAQADADRELAVPLVRRFADACMVITGDEKADRVRGDELRAAYELWAEANGLPKLIARTFGMGMTALGVNKKQVLLPDKSAAPINYLGVQLKPMDQWVMPESQPQPEVEAEPEPESRPEWMKPENGYAKSEKPTYEGDQPGGEIAPDYRTKIVLPLIEQGWVYRRSNANGGGKPRITNPQGKTFSLASTPSDVRGIKNTMATLRRMGARI